jgi:hypothetical protein
LNINNSIVIKEENLDSMSVDKKKNSFNKLAKFSIDQIIPKSVKYSYIYKDNNNPLNMTKFSYFDMFKQHKNPNLPFINKTRPTYEGNLFRDIYKGTSSILIKPKLENENLLKKLILSKEETTKYFKKAVKLKILRSLHTSKSLHVETLLKFYKNIQWFLEIHKYKLKKNLFKELTRLLNQKNDDEFIDNIFLVFDKNNENIIDFKELIVGLTIFRDDSYSNKMFMLVDLCETDSNNCVNMQEFIKLIKIFIFNNKDAKQLMDIIKKTFSDLNVNVDQLILLEFIQNNKEIAKIIKRNKESVTEIENFLDDQINTISKSNLKQLK